MTTKVCCRCRKRKSVERFSPDKSNKDGLVYNCKDCANEYRKRTRQIPRYKRKEQNQVLIKKYGITLKEQRFLLKAQRGRCAICGTCRPGGKYNKWQTDHDHKDKRVRGLLCYRCNTGLGFFGDKSEILLKAAIYLRRDENENN
jgi:hypothetical protein